MTLCVQIGGKGRIACERVVSCGPLSAGRYEHFARLRHRGALAACRSTRKHAMRLSPPVSRFRVVEV